MKSLLSVICLAGENRFQEAVILCEVFYKKSESRWEARKTPMSLPFRSFFITEEFFEGKLVRRDLEKSFKTLIWIKKNFKKA